MEVGAENMLPLNIACFMCNIHVAEVLLKAGADVNGADVRKLIPSFSDYFSSQSLSTDRILSTSFFSLTFRPYVSYTV